MAEDRESSLARESLRRTFDSAAELYDRARPVYPPELFASLVELTGVVPGAHVLEIGPGTGQATIALAQLGLRVTALELGADLAAVARRNLEAFPDVQVEVGEFESWQPTPGDGPYDLVVAATAWRSAPRRRTAASASGRTADAGRGRRGLRTL